MSHTDTLEHALEIGRIEQNRPALIALKAEILTACQEFLSHLEESAADRWRKTHRSRAATVEQCRAAFAEIQAKPLEWFAQYHDWKTWKQPYEWSGRTITAEQLGAASLLKMVGKIGK